MKRKLERLDENHEGPNDPDKYEIAIKSDDGLTVCEISSKPGWYGLHVQNKKCANVISLWGLTPEQLADLHSQIGSALGIPPTGTVEHLRQLHRVLSSMLYDQA